MKTKLTLFLLLTISLVNAQIPSFATKKSLGNDMVARINAGFAARNNKLYIIGGYANCSPKDFSEYDPSTGVMNKLKNLGNGCANPILIPQKNIERKINFFILQISEKGRS